MLNWILSKCFKFETKRITIKENTNLYTNIIDSYVLGQIYSKNPRFLKSMRKRV